MVLLTYILTLAVSFSAQAQEANIDARILGGGFYQIGQLPLSPKNVERAADATVKIDGCSAVLLSPKGYVATNVHCIADYLHKHWNYDPNVKLTDINVHGVSGLKVEERIPGRIDWPDDVKRGLAIDRYDLRDPQIVWIGTGNLEYDETSIADLNEDEFNSVKDVGQDIVFLKYGEVPRDKNIPCVPLARAEPKKDDLARTRKPPPLSGVGI